MAPAATIISIRALLAAASPTVRGMSTCRITPPTGTWVSLLLAIGAFPKWLFRLSLGPSMLAT
ncbi:MAG: hypothetical protein ABC596_10015, partial [Candidatus Methanosuratincola petrocarbonis]